MKGPWYGISENARDKFLKDDYNEEYSGIIKNDLNTNKYMKEFKIDEENKLIEGETISQ